MARTLTFWSIIIGFFLGASYSNAEKFISIWQDQSFQDALYSLNYIALIITATIAVFLGALFYVIEKEQNQKATADTKITNILLMAIAKKLGVDIESLNIEIRQDRNERRNRNH